MLQVDEEAVICDLAETYNIYDYKSLPMLTVATFCVGLRENSRIKLKMNEQNYPLDTILLASLVDRLSVLIWQNSKDGKTGRNQPPSLVEKLQGVEKVRDYEVFESPEAFEEALKRLNER